MTRGLYTIDCKTKHGLIAVHHHTSTFPVSQYNIIELGIPRAGHHAESTRLSDL
jgi:hypothetical protein